MVIFGKNRLSVCTKQEIAGHDRRIIGDASTEKCKLSRRNVWARVGIE